MSPAAPTVTPTAVARDRGVPPSSAAVTRTVVGPAVSATRAGSTRRTTGVRSSSAIRPVAVSVAVTGDVVPETRRLTVNVSSSSSTASSMVGTVNVRVSPARPAKRTGCPAAR